MSDIFNTDGTLAGNPVQGQIVVNPGSTRGDALIFNRESAYDGQAITSTSGDLEGRFDDITYYG